MAFSYHSKTPCLAFVNIYKYSFCFALLCEGWIFFPLSFFLEVVFVGLFLVFFSSCQSIHLGEHKMPGWDYFMQHI